MEARRKKFEELDITRDEINNIGKALQKEEFRKLFVEYCEEVNSQENKKKYEAEITELEKQRGVDVTFINPEPGFVVKTSVDGVRKAFINICKNGKVSSPTSTPASQDGSRGQQWSLPFSLAPPREDLDKQRNRCSVFDVVFHPDTLKSAESSVEFRRMLIGTALDAVENHCNVGLDRANLKYPKMTYKGLQQSAVIRKKIPHHVTSEDDQEFFNSVPYPPAEDSWSSMCKQKDDQNKEKVSLADYATPKYVIRYRHNIDIADFTNDSSSHLNATVPKELVVEIDLPLLRSVGDVSLDVTNKSLSILSKQPKYKLDLVLPYGVNEDAGQASYDTASRKLIVVLPVKRSTPLLIDGSREDSGVESDLGVRPDEESDDKCSCENSDEGSEHSDIPLVEEISSISEPAASQTNSESMPSCDTLCKEDVLYTLPNFTCNAFEDVIAFTLHVKNVEENSVRHQAIMNNSGMQLCLSSLGGGLFPVHYALCVVFPEGVTLNSDSIGLEVWDNNVVVQCKLEVCHQPITELLVGTGPHDLQTQDYPNLAHIEKVLSDLQMSTQTVESYCPSVELLKSDSEELVLIVKPASEGIGEGESTEPVTNSLSVSKPLEHNKPVSEKPSPSALERGGHRKNAVRQLSECSNDDLNGRKIRGILKKRSMRSLSESNADEYSWMNRSISDDAESAAPSSALGSELCVAEVGSEAGCETENESGDKQSKKTVRFSDVIAKQTFRPNSSILGQKKKNQRKRRNKKRAQERRASESENSEPETDLRKGHERGSASDGNLSDTFLKNVSQHSSQPKAGKIVVGAYSSETDEDSIRDKFCLVSKKPPSPKNQIPANNGPQNASVESSEDERDVKTDGSKKTKKRKGKKVSEDPNKLMPKPSNHEQPEFKSSLMHELEM